MDLLKELKPFNEHLDHFKKGYGITDTIAIQKLADIWDAFADTRKKEIYGSESAVIPRTKTTCASCIKDMMNMLYNWREIVTREDGERLVDFKAVKKANVTEVKPPIDLSIKQARHILDSFVPPVKYHHKAKIETLVKLIKENESK